MRAFLRLVLPFILCSCLSLPAALYPGQTPIASSEQSLTQAPVEIEAAYNQIVDSFNLYNTFLEADYRYDGKFLLRHARNPDQAYDFLACGFSADMAKRICEAYTIWNPQLRELLLMPQDGLPVLNHETRRNVVFSQNKPDYIDFMCIFTNCYAPGDAYRYSVTAHLEDGRWKVDDLNLEPLAGGERSNSGIMYASQSS